MKIIGANWGSQCPVLPAGFECSINQVCCCDLTIEEKDRIHETYIALYAFLRNYSGLINQCRATIIFYDKDCITLKRESTDAGIRETHIII